MAQIDLTAKDEFDLFLACIRGEAESEPLFGKLAVACVVRNRVNDPRWPDTYKEVLLQRKQFSCFLPQFLRPEIFTRRHNKSFWRECKYAAYGIYHNWAQDITFGATNYYSTIINEPYWAKGKIPVLEIGKHKFYKL